MKLKDRTIRVWELNHNEPKPQHMPSIIQLLGYISFNIEVDFFFNKLKIAKYFAGHSMESLGQYLGLSKDAIEHNEYETLKSKLATKTILKQFVDVQFSLLSTHKQ